MDRPVLAGVARYGIHRMACAARSGAVRIPSGREWTSGDADGDGGGDGVFGMAGMAGTDGLRPVPGCAGLPI